MTWKCQDWPLSLYLFHQYYYTRQIEHKNKTGDVCSSDEEEDPSVSDYHVSDSDSVDTAQDEDSLDDDYSVSLMYIFCQKSSPDQNGANKKIIQNGPAI